jgi:intracellular septation protein A
VIDEFLGLYWGVIAAVIVGLGELIFYRVKDKTWDKLVVVSTALIVVFGVLSIVLNSPVFVMIKPAVFETLFAVILLVMYFLKKSFIEETAKKYAGIKEIPELHRKYLHGVTLRIAVIFFIHSGLIVYSAIRLGKKEWMFINGVLFYVFFFVLLAFEFFYARYFMRRQYKV